MKGGVAGEVGPMVGKVVKVVVVVEVWVRHLVRSGE